MPSSHVKQVFTVKHYYYYRYSALGPVWAETRAQSVNWYSFGTLHPGQVLRGSLPLLSPAFRLPTFATRCLNDATDHDYVTPYSSLTCKKQFRNDFPISPVPINIILSDELFLWHSKCARLWLYQYKKDSLQSYFQQLMSKYAFFATATSTHCQTVPGISLLHNLQESVLGWIFQLSYAAQINSVLSGELFAWHKQCAGQKMFLSSLGVLWQYLSHFVTLSKKTDEITCSLDLDYHMEVKHTLQRFQTSSTSYTSHAHFIWVG